MLSDPNGNVGRLLGDPTLYDRVNKLTTDISAILEDFQKNPRKYTKGAICVFHCK
jgi:hypothetical protein